MCLEDMESQMSSHCLDLAVMFACIFLMCPVRITRLLFTDSCRYRMSFLS